MRANERAAGSARRRARVALSGIAFLAAGILGWRWLPGPAESPASRPERAKAREAVPPATRPGDALLQAYGAAGSSAEEDLGRLGQVLDNFRLLHKGLDARFLATNADVAAALRGETPGTTPFVAAEAPIFDGAGRLVDRWGRPLVVHPVSAERIELRSAGPDGQAWNDDDWVRLAGGRVVRGSALVGVGAARGDF